MHLLYPLQNLEESSMLPTKATFETTLALDNISLTCT